MQNEAAVGCEDLRAVQLMRVFQELRVGSSSMSFHCST
jgi:hypothetical protein